ncbi:hypothetical protein BP6252_11205 [Coleophoma cylindrospora]|uniref:Uncharacterized protein n=1 Tax=Coleophoma cylindrospora TaxID=1849047 RepID=A0A3D8QPV0_9HELO|nr:hypothetical protein BP6252_11205 [Coleophoma cylindrospora]
MVFQSRIRPGLRYPQPSDMGEGQVEDGDGLDERYIFRTPEDLGGGMQRLIAIPGDPPRGLSADGFRPANLGLVTA